MDQILIYKPNGDSEAINNNSLVSVITQAEHKKALLGEDVISMTIESASVRNFAIGDYIQVFGMPKYKLNKQPILTKIAERKYRYELQFEGLQYDLLRASYRNTDISSFNTSSDFSLIGDIEMFLNVLVNNLKRVFGEDSWALGTFPTDTETKNLSFSNENCLGVLQRLCEEYKYEFICQEGVSSNILNVKSAGTDLDYSFRYGQGKGLYELSRENVDSKNIINRLWAYGSEKNLPANYKNYSPRLRLGNSDDLPILETVSQAAYGIFEGSVIFDEIYPQRIGVVSGINTSNRLEFTDEDMDFDLNETHGGTTKYLIPGNVAKVHFQTGNLAGYEFEVEKYDSETNTFTIKQNKDPKGISMPSPEESAFQIATGDTYILIDIMMPNTYVTAAEAVLEAKAIEYLNNNAFPNVKYNLTLDEFYLRDKATSMNVFEVGDTVQIVDTELGIDTRIKIIEYSRDILRPYKYSLVIKDMPQPTLMRNIVSQMNMFGRIIKQKGLNDPTKNKADWRSDTQILAEIPAYLKKQIPLMEVGTGADTTRIGMAGGLVEVLADLGIKNPLGHIAELKSDALTSNREVSFPDMDIVVNDWDYIVGVPESFPSLTTDYGLIGTQNSINKVFQTSSNFVLGSTIVYINGVRQFLGVTADYQELSSNTIEFSLAPYSDDRLIIDFQKL